MNQINMYPVNLRNVMSNINKKGKKCLPNLIFYIHSVEYSYFMYIHILGNVLR